MTAISTLPSVRKKKMAEASEILDAIGHENEKEGIKWTQRFMSQWDKKQWEKQQIKRGELDKKRRFSRMGYHELVAGMLQEELKDLDVPPGYRTWTEFSGEGVIVRMVDSKGKKYNRAFRPDGTPEVDFRAVVGLLTDVQNSVDILEQERAENLKTMGIVLPS